MEARGAIPPTFALQRVGYLSHYSHSSERGRLESTFPNFAARYGTGSGSDRAPVTRSLPLPVPYRSAPSRHTYLYKYAGWRRIQTSDNPLKNSSKNFHGNSFG